MVSHDRQQVIETNRSLRNIKNELESLLEKGVITEDAFDTFHRLLPTEGSVANPGAAARAPTAAAALPTPATTPLNNAPPSYAQSQSTGGGPPPPLPGRSQPAPAAPAKPVVAHCRALYGYAAQDARDCSFDKGDRIAVYEKMNADWWLGMNTRTREEGIFPKSYVEEEPAANSWGGNNEKAAYPAAPVTGAGGYPPPPGRVDPYNAHAPPMALANNGSGGSGEPPSKTEENTKKFGKKLGNAAIFGAGATLGGKIVNSIF